MLRIPPFFGDFAVLDDSKKYTPFLWNLEHSWLPLFMLSEGTGCKVYWGCMELQVREA